MNTDSTGKKITIVLFYLAIALGAIMAALGYNQKDNFDPREEDAPGIDEGDPT
jgi:uncharacterized membrane protein